MLTKALAILVITCSSAFAQPQGDRDQPPERRQKQGERIKSDTPPSATELRNRLQQTLEFAKRIVEKNEAAIAQLDAGEDPRQVMHSLRTPEKRQAMRKTNRSQSLGTALSHPASDEQIPPPPLLSKKELQMVRSFISEHLDVIDKQLKQVEQVSPDATDRLLGRLAPKILEILQLRESDPAMASLKLDDLKAGLSYIDASRNYRSMLRSNSNDHDNIKNAEQEVRQAASARFDAQVQIKQYEIHLLTKRIGQLHEALDALNAQRDDQVNAQVNSAKRSPGPRHNRPANDPPQSNETSKASPED